MKIFKKISFFLLIFNVCLGKILFNFPKGNKKKILLAKQLLGVLADDKQRNLLSVGQATKFAVIGVGAALLGGVVGQIHSKVKSDINYLMDSIKSTIKQEVTPVFAYPSMFDNKHRKLQEVYNFKLRETSKEISQLKNNVNLNIEKIVENIHHIHDLSDNVDDIIKITKNLQEFIAITQEEKRKKQELLEKQREDVIDEVEELKAIKQQEKEDEENEYELLQLVKNMKDPKLTDSQKENEKFEFLQKKSKKQPRPLLQETFKRKYQRINNIFENNPKHVIKEVFKINN